MNPYEQPQQAASREGSRQRLRVCLALVALLILSLYSTPLWLPWYEALINTASQRAVWTVERALRLLSR